MTKPLAACRTGRYTGRREESGVFSFRGIRYAQGPRFRAPVPVPPGSDVMDATRFGPTAPQSFLHDEPASASPDMSEDCLTVNIWTRFLPSEGSPALRPVMFWIHGGSYGWGGTVDPLYDGQYLAASDQAPVVVSVEYRVNALGFSDLSQMPDGKKWTRDMLSQSGFLGLMDCQEALRWVRGNIASFGGDPENITVFGESAGGGLVSLLMVSDGSFDEQGRCLFRRAIAQSGTVNLTYDLAGLRETNQIGLIMKALVRNGVFDSDQRIAGWTEKTLEEKTSLLTLDDLMEVSTKDLIAALNADSGTVSVEGSSTVGGQNSFPLRTSEVTDEQGHVIASVKSIIPADPYEALDRAAKAGVELMIGTNGDEFRYWLNDLGDRDLRQENEEGLRTRIRNFREYLAGAYASLMAAAAGGEGEAPEWLESLPPELTPGSDDPEEWAAAAAAYFFRLWTEAYHASLSEGKTPCRDDARYADCAPEETWIHTELATQLSFRMPSVLFAESFLKAGGKVWMYYFDRKADMEIIGTLLGSCHASEVAYTLNNVAHGTQFSGRVDPALARDMSELWIRFAAAGVPSLKGFTVRPYDTAERSSLYISDEGRLSNLPDPLKTVRLFLEPFAEAWRLM